jgi:hypothetical protein
MIVLGFNVQTNLINWIFFILNILNLGISISGTHNLYSVESSIKITRIIKFFALFILIFDTLFICFVGEVEKVNDPESLDQRIKDKHPNVFNSF